MRDTLTRPTHSEGSATGRQRESDLGEPGSATASARSLASGSRPPLVDRAAKWPIAELLLGICLLTAGIVLVLVQLGVEIRLDVVLPALAVLGGVALAIAPWLLRLNRELIAERSGRAREAERAEIAAHLHDSVLQTLAAIQQRSEPGSEVARLARGQERDLREWLFRTADGAVPPERALPEDELREHAAMLEADHAVRFEVVSVGSGGAAPEAIVAAAREAMLNAARHAGGEVTVYLETTPARVSIDVTDRGPGFDLEGLPEGRMGVRESILGRMQRAGGDARIAPGPGGSGTAVRLSMPLEPADAPGETHADRGRTHG